MKNAIPLALLGLSFTIRSLMASPPPEPLKDLGAIMPRHGTVSISPATNWDTGIASGNGIMGAMLAGGVGHDEILVDHAKLWLPKGTAEKLPSTAPDLTELRQVIHQKGYREGQKYFMQKATEAGWGGELVWTDAYHPAFSLTIDEPAGERPTDYARVENFSTGEVWSQWKTSAGDFNRRLFVSRPDNTIVATLRGPAGKVSFQLGVKKIDSPLIQPGITVADGWILFHNVYVKGKGGYDAVVRVTTEGGTLSANPGGQTISVNNANAATLYVRVLPWRTPLPESQSWITDPANPDFAAGHHPARRDSVQMAARQYDPRWLEELKADVGALGSYEDLLRTHAAVWSKLYDRVSIDLGGTAKERASSSEALLEDAQKKEVMSAALLERMYDAGRYVFLCSAGPQTPPNLFGIWTDGWKPAWSGDYTTDTNLQLDCECAYSANLAEAMAGYFYLWDSFLPDFRRNAKSLYGCRGILAGTRHSNNGLALHWGGWPGNTWTPGAPWIAHWYYDYYTYTMDRGFLQKEAIPFMKECALFYEDFLKGTEDAGGHYTFCPSYSAENGNGDNASQDIEICHELLTNLITGCQTLGIEADGVARWKALLAKLPPLMVNAQGQLKEWADPALPDRNDHRHLMHLYGAFESGQFNEEDGPALFAAARVALVNRIISSHEDATHGHMHMALAAASLGLGDYSYARLSMLARHRSIFPSMIDAHYGGSNGPSVLCVDGNGATPEIVNRMIVQSKLGRLELLPAVPAALPRGTLAGTRARGGIGVDRVTWDMPGGKLSAVLTSGTSQNIALALPPDVVVDHLKVDGVETPATAQGVRKPGCTLKMTAGKPVSIEAGFHPLPPKPVQ